MFIKEDERIRVFYKITGSLSTGFVGFIVESAPKTPKKRFYRFATR